MPDSGPSFIVKLAETDSELRAAQALRYDVFVRELGGGGDLVDHDAGLERDRFDPFADHLIVIDAGTDKLVGVYRLMRDDQARAAGQFYSETEYDLSVLKSSGRRLLELGRSCLHPSYRGGTAMHHMWTALAGYVADHDIDVLFGVASFHGTDVAAIAEPLSLLYQKHLAPLELRVCARGAHFQTMDIVPAERLNRRRAMVQVPALIKAYLRLGGFVGHGAYIDKNFNTIDVCLVVDTKRMNARRLRLYAGGTRR